MPLTDLDMAEVGRSIQLVGAVYAKAGTDDAWVLLLPGEEPIEAASVTLDQDEWLEFLRQTDLVEIRALVKDEHGKVGRAIVRKCERQVSQNVSWEVFRRDGYRCRYCGADQVPLTVDHLVTWESGGPSTPENLVACCKRCNNVRGETPFDEWLKDPYFKRVRKGLSIGERFALDALVPRLADIPRSPIVVKQGKKRKR